MAFSFVLSYLISPAALALLLFYYLNISGRHTVEHCQTFFLQHTRGQQSQLNHPLSPF